MVVPWYGAKQVLRHTAPYYTPYCTTDQAADLKPGINFSLYVKVFEKSYYDIAAAIPLTPLSSYRSRDTPLRPLCNKPKFMRVIVYVLQIGAQGNHVIIGIQNSHIDFVVGTQNLLWLALTDPVEHLVVKGQGF